MLGALSSSELVSFQYMMNRSEISPIIQVYILFVEADSHFFVSVIRMFYSLWGLTWLFQHVGSAAWPSSVPSGL